MTAPTTSVSTTPARAAQPRARFRDLLAAEWIKLWSLRSTYGVLGGGALVLIGLNVQTTLVTYRRMPDWPAEQLADYNWLHEAFARAPYMLLALAAGTVGALAITGEYSTGLIRTTVAAVPARRSLVAAKAIVLMVVMTLIGTAVAATSFGVTQAILARRGGGFSVGDPGVLPGIAGSALLPAVCALVGLGIGALVRHTAAAVFSVVAVILLLPEATTGDTYRWVVEVHEALPFSAWDFLRNAPMTDIIESWGDPWAMPSPTETWLTFAAWPLVAVALAVVAVGRRDL
jgi:hypothetical protein